MRRNGVVPLLERRICVRVIRVVAAAAAFYASTALDLTINWSAAEGERRETGSIVYQQTRTAGVPLKVLWIDLNAESVKVSGVVARGGPGSTESWSGMIARARPRIAVTGTYFGLNNNLPIGDLVIAGRLVHFGGKGTALCVDPDNVATFQKVAPYRHKNWSAYDYVLRSGPRLVWGGVAYVNPRGEGFRDPSLSRRAARIAIGVTRANKLIIAATRKPITLWQLAGAMKGLGAWNAINLDGGSSTGLYVDGKTLIAPKRKLTNLLVVYDDVKRYQSVRGVLAPAKVTAHR